MNGITRRRILMSGLAAILPTGAAFAALPRNPDIVIVGAGMAGLAAAQALRRAGFSIAVLEARSRIGGRAYTERDSFGVPFDHGCAWLHAGARNPLVRLSGDLGFRVWDDNGLVQLFAEGKSAGTAAAERFQVAIGKLQAVIDEAGAAGQDVPVANIFKPRDTWERLALLMTSTTTYGVEPSDVSVVDSYNRIAIGNKILVPRGLGSAVNAYGLRMPVALGRPVERIAWSGSGVEVRTSAGTLRPKAALLTVSTGVLSSGAIRFDPDLPVWKQEAISNVPMGLLNKIALQYRRGAIDAPPGTWLLGQDRNGRALSFLIDPFDGGLVICFVGGALAGALERSGDRAAIDYARAELSSVLGSGMDRGFRRARVTAWASDPWALGSFSAAKPGHARMRQVLALPVGKKIYFAGEATHSSWAAQLPGAYLSGAAAGAQIVKDFG